MGVSIYKVYVSFYMGHSRPHWLAIMSNHVEIGIGQSGTHIDEQEVKGEYCHKVLIIFLYLKSLAMLSYWMGRLLQTLLTGDDCVLV